jgi:hypothetical protein
MNLSLPRPGLLDGKIWQDPQKANNPNLFIMKRNFCPAFFSLSLSLTQLAIAKESAGDRPGQWADIPPVGDPPLAFEKPDRVNKIIAPGP